MIFYVLIWMILIMCVALILFIFSKQRKKWQLQRKQDALEAEPDHFNIDNIGKNDSEEKD